jgi:hypothetical protein
MGASTVAIAITAAERRLVRRLRDAGARSAATARPLPGLRHLEARRLEHLKDAGAIREAAPGTYYVDDEAYEAYRGDRRSVVLAVALAVAGAAIIFSLLGRA